MNVIEKRPAETASPERGAQPIRRPNDLARHQKVAGSRRSWPPQRPWGSSFWSLPPPCRIFRPSRSAMQSGKANTRRWVLEFEPARPKWIEPLMGWTASDDPFAQIHLTFPTKEAAIAYAECAGLDYRVAEPPLRRIRPKFYRPAVWINPRSANAKETQDAGPQISCPMGTEV